MTPSPAHIFRRATLPLAATFALASALVPAASAAPSTPQPTDSSERGAVAEQITESLSDGQIPAAERKALAEQASEALGEKVLPARMGQGQKRIAETGDAQVPTLDELAELGRAAQRFAMETDHRLSGLRERLAVGAAGADRAAALRAGVVRPVQ